MPWRSFTEAGLSPLVLSFVIIRSHCRHSLSDISRLVSIDVVVD
jgi:hypothetical protein